MRPADSALGIFRNPDPNILIPRPQEPPNLSQVVASVFHFRIVKWRILRILS